MTEETLTRTQDGYNCFRLCFAACPEEDIKPISRRFVKGAQAFWRIKDTSVIDDLLDDLDDETIDTKENLDALTHFC